MGRFLAAAACVLACFVAPGSWAGGINPAHWPKDQWRSDLFDSYPQHQRHRRVHITKQVVHIRIDAAVPRTRVVTRVPARPLVIRNGAAINTVPPAVIPAGRAACDGVLVLTWAGDHARSTCHRGKSTANR